ncbi:MAG: hypothetical protein AAF125_28130, partial [Chloroflexota bacterium]
MAFAVNNIEAALSPREARIVRAAGVLRWGGLLNGIALITLVVVSWLIASGVSLLPTLKTATL